MRKYWTTALPISALVLAATLVSRFPANAVAMDEFHQPSILMDQVTTAKETSVPTHSTRSEFAQSNVFGPLPC